MKLLSEKKALEELKELKKEFRKIIKQNYEFRAKDCKKCTNECCLDAKFVNVHITKLEAVLMHKHLSKYKPERISEIKQRISRTIKEFGLTQDTETSGKTFACPLFEHRLGCLVHEVKPIACIQHACYQKHEDLPPDSLQIEFERKIERLNEKTYGKPTNWLPLPIWLDLTKDHL